MALPDAHLATLEVLIRRHEAEIETLRASFAAIGREITIRRRGSSRLPKRDTAGLEARRVAIRREIAAHEQLVAVGRDQDALETLSEVVSDAKLAREVAADPLAFAAARGLVLPAKLRVVVGVADERVSVRFENYDEQCPVILTWDDSGFGAAPERESKPRG